MAVKARGAVWLTALGIGLFQVIGSFGAASEQPDRRGIDVLALVFVLVGPAALAVRDRWPLAAVAVAVVITDLYIACGYPYGPIFLSVVVALFAAVVMGRRRPTWLLAAGGYVGFVAASMVDPRADGVGLGHLGLVAGWLIVVLVMAELVRARRSQFVERERAEEEARERREGEQRLELAQELHDVLAHNISMINVQASVALHLIDEQPAQAGLALANIKQASRDALHELRTALDVLRRGEEAPRSPAPRLAELGSLVDGVRAGGLEVHVEQSVTQAVLPAAVELAAYRIVQEALTNVARHARAQVVTVRLAFDDGVRIEVIDDGIGGSADSGNGVRGMRERATALGGTVEAGPMPGRGFRVAAHLPNVQP